MRERLFRRLCRPKVRERYYTSKQHNIHLKTTPIDLYYMAQACLLSTLVQFDQVFFYDSENWDSCAIDAENVDFSTPRLSTYIYELLEG